MHCRVYRAFKVSRVFKDCMDILPGREYKVNKDCKVLKVLKVLRVFKASKVFKEY